MPSKIIKRGKQRLVGTVMVNGRRVSKLFPDVSKSSTRAALVWEERKRNEVLSRTGEEVAIDEWVGDYLEFAKQRYHGRNTYTAKESTLLKFSSFIGGRKPVKQITIIECQRYLRKQALQRTGNAANRDRKELATAWEYGKRYFGFPANPFREVDKFPETKYSKYVPPLKDFLKVLNKTSGQDWVMLMFFLCLAPRRSEVFGLKRDDIDFENKRIRLWTRKRKGGNLESDWLPAIDSLIDILQAWYPNRRAMQSKDRSHFFISTKTKKPFIARSGLMKGLCRKAGVKRFNFHAIRHLTALFLYYNGETTQTIQLILRHKDPRTTSKYLKRIGVEEGRKGLGKISQALSPVVARGLEGLKAE